MSGLRRRVCGKVNIYIERKEKEGEYAIRIVSPDGKCRCAIQEKLGAPFPPDSPTAYDVAVREALTEVARTLPEIEIYENGEADSKDKWVVSRR